MEIWDYPPQPRFTNLEDRKVHVTRPWTQEGLAIRALMSLHGHSVVVIEPEGLQPEQGEGIMLRTGKRGELIITIHDKGQPDDVALTEED